MVTQLRINPPKHPASRGSSGSYTKQQKVQNPFTKASPSNQSVSSRRSSNAGDISSPRSINSLQAKQREYYSSDEDDRSVSSYDSDSTNSSNCSKSKMMAAGTKSFETYFSYDSEDLKKDRSAANSVAHTNDSSTLDTGYSLPFQSKIAASTSRLANKAPVSPTSDVKSGRASISSSLTMEDKLRSLHKTASNYLKRREFNASLKSFEEIHEILCKYYNTKWHGRIGTSFHNLSIVYLQQGDLDKSVESIEDALEVKRATVGEKNVKVIESLVQMGIILATRKEWDDALEVLGEALELAESLEGPDSLLVAKILNNIGCIHYESDELAEAHLAWEEAAEIQEHIIDEAEYIESDFLSCASTLNNLSYLLLNANRFKECIGKLEDALAIQEVLLNKGHNLILHTLGNLAYVHYREKNFDAALKYYKQLLVNQRKVLGSDHIDVADTLIKVAKVYLKMCQFDKSLSIVKTVLNFHEKHYGEHHKRTVKTHSLLESVEHVSTKLKGSVVVSLQKRGLKNPFTNKRLEYKFLGDISGEINTLKWDIRRPSNTTKMSGQRVSYA